jgi:hypothetical protein
MPRDSIGRFKAIPRCACCDVTEAESGSECWLDQCDSCGAPMCDGCISMCDGQCDDCRPPDVDDGDDVDEEDWGDGETDATP